MSYTLQNLWFSNPLLNNNLNFYDGPGSNAQYEINPVRYDFNYFFNPTGPNVVAPPSTVAAQSTDLITALNEAAPFVTVGQLNVVNPINLTGTGSTVSGASGNNLNGWSYDPKFGFYANAGGQIGDLSSMTSFLDAATDGTWQYETEHTNQYLSDKQGFSSRGIGADPQSAAYYVGFAYVGPANTPGAVTLSGGPISATPSSPMAPTMALNNSVQSDYATHYSLFGGNSGNDSIDNFSANTNSALTDAAAIANAEEILQETTGLNNWYWDPTAGLKSIGAIGSQWLASSTVKTDYLPSEASSQWTYFNNSYVNDTSNKTAEATALANKQRIDSVSTTAVSVETAPTSSLATSSNLSAIEGLLDQNSVLPTGAGWTLSPDSSNANGYTFTVDWQDNVQAAQLAAAANTSAVTLNSPNQAQSDATTANNDLNAANQAVDKEQTDLNQANSSTSWSSEFAQQGISGFTDNASLARAQTALSDANTLQSMVSNDINTIGNALNAAKSLLSQLNNNAQYAAIVNSDISSMTADYNKANSYIAAINGYISTDNQNITVWNSPPPSSGDGGGGGGDGGAY